MDRVIDLHANKKHLLQPPAFRIRNVKKTPPADESESGAKVQVATDHDPIHPVLLVSLQDGLLDTDLNARLIPLILPGRADESEFVLDPERGTGLAGELSVVGVDSKGGAFSRESREWKSEWGWFVRVDSWGLNIVGI
jgi:hypothetical protein